MQETRLPAQNAFSMNLARALSVLETSVFSPSLVQPESLTPQVPKQLPPSSSYTSTGTGEGTETGEGARGRGDRRQERPRLTLHLPERQGLHLQRHGTKQVTPRSGLCCEQWGCPALQRRDGQRFHTIHWELELRILCPSPATHLPCRCEGRAPRLNSGSRVGTTLRFPTVGSQEGPSTERDCGLKHRSPTQGRGAQAQK